MSRLNSFAALAGAALLAAVALPGPARANDTLRIGTPEAVALSFGMLDTGVATGTFAKYGIDIERMDFAGSAKLHPAMAAGAIDIAMGSGSDLMFIARGVPEIGIGAFESLPNDLLISTLADGPVKTLADLKGRKMGVAGPGGLTLWIAMSASIRQGWGPQGIQYVFLGTIPSINAGLITKGVDAVVTDIGSGFGMEVEGRTHVLALGGDVVHPFVAHLAFASNELVQKNPALIKRYLKALYETIAWTKTHEEETLRITHPRNNYADAIAHKAFMALAPYMLADGHFDPAALAATKQSLIDLEVVKPEDMPADAKLVTEAYLP